MTIRTALVALTLAVAPAVTLAGGCFDREHQAQTCAPGHVWDSVQQSCIKQVTG